MKKLFVLLPVLIVLCMLVSPAAAADRAHTLIVANPADATTLDPVVGTDGASMGLMLQIYEGLLKYDFKKQEILPLLAEKWEQTDDRTYRFTLREGVKFHNGETMKASDVKFSFERAMGPLGTANKLYAEHIESVETPDDHTVVIRLKAPFTPFAAALTLTWASIVGQKAVEKLGENFTMDATGAGTGPFKFVSWTKGDRVILDRFDGYWGKPTSLEQIVMRSVPEATGRTIELESGAVDLSLIIPVNDIKRISEDPELKVQRTLDYIVTYMGMNQSRPALKDPRVREAIALAVDVEALHKAIWRDTGKVPNGPLSWVTRYSAHDIPAPKQDVEKARLLLKEAGVKNLKLNLWTADRKERIDAATILQSQLAEVGIDVEIQVLEWGAFLDGLVAGKPDLFILGSGFFDPGLTLKAMYTSTSNSNYTHTQDAMIDELTDKALTIPDGPEREKLFIALQKRLTELHPAVFLNDEEYLVGANKKVEGFTPDPRGYHSLVGVYFK